MRANGHHQRATRVPVGENFIPRAANLVFIGDTGVGKTGLASAILLRALQHGYHGLFIKAQDLFDDMYRSLADHSSRALMLPPEPVDGVASESGDVHRPCGRRRSSG